MAYHGYIPIIHELVSESKFTSILEIGISSGITTFSLVQRLTSDKKKFCYTGVDILIQESVIETLKYFSLLPDQSIRLFRQNSLDFLQNCNEKFDIILIDGDHNYHTVFNELKFLDKISHESTVVICDDYDGRWSQQDMFYSERSEYAENSLATPRKQEENKTGVRAAVDDFLESNCLWNKIKMIEGEPVLLTKSNKTRFV